MQPQIDFSQLSIAEREALQHWRVAEVIQRYNQETNMVTARGLLVGVRTMLDVLARTPPPIGPANNMERDLIGRVLSGVEYALRSLGGNASHMPY